MHNVDNSLNTHALHAVSLTMERRPGVGLLLSVCIILSSRSYNIQSYTVRVSAWMRAINHPIK